MIERFFELKKSNTSIQTELLAGFTTFLTMAYIIFVNPAILSDAGMPRDAVFVATCLVGCLSSLIMGLYANYPIACAPGMGLNAYFAYTIVLGMGFTWQVALGAVFFSGCLFLIVSICGIRQLIINNIPNVIRIGITSGIGLFLVLIAFKSSKVIVAHPVTFLTLGDLHQPEPLLAILGFFIIVGLDLWRVKGAILIGIIAITLLSIIFNHNQYHGIVAMPPSIAPTFMELNISSLLSLGMVQVVLVLFLVEIFDATGTLMGVANRAGLLVPEKMQRLNRALFADSIAITAGSILGTSSTTAYIESTAGVQAGGRTGLTAITVAVLFLVALFFAPLASMVPSYATAPALLYVACLMASDLAKINWHKLSDAIPAVLTAFVMPFTYSIADGVAFGFISYALLKLLCGEAKRVSYLVWIMAFIFMLRFAYLD